MSHSGVALIDPTKVFEKIALSDGARVADFGCGRTGHFVFSASGRVGDKGVVYALDIVKDVLESIRSRVASEGYGNVQTVWTDIESVGAAPIPDKSLDAGFFVNVMFMLKNKSGALKEAARLLKKDALLVIVDWAKKIGPLGPPPERMVKTDDLIRLAAETGFEKSDSFSLSEYSFCLILKKM